MYHRVTLWPCVCVFVFGRGENAVPIKRCPCCNQCTEALGPICYYINLELMETHKCADLCTHPNTFLPTVLTLSERPPNSRADTHTHAHAWRVYTLKHTQHTCSWERRQPTGPSSEHSAHWLVHKQILMRSFQRWIVHVSLIDSSPHLSCFFMSSL